MVRQDAGWRALEKRRNVFVFSLLSLFDG